MEINQRLFDECSQNFNREREDENAKLKEKLSKWEIIEKKARQNPQFSEVSQQLQNTCSSLAQLSVNENGRIEPVDTTKIKQQAARYAIDYVQERPLTRRKSELPHDPNTDRALDEHRRHEPYLPTVPHE
ncbi:unnamed protein product [Onchocerca ochengi]|nr:unnamed protein product [Onchocerca ochengi]